jgi:hypothetical protein
LPNKLFADLRRTFAGAYASYPSLTFQAYSTLSTGRKFPCRRFLPEACGFSFAFDSAFYVGCKFLFFPVQVQR